MSGLHLDRIGVMGFHPSERGSPRLRDGPKISDTLPVTAGRTGETKVVLVIEELEVD